MDPHSTLSQFNQRLPKAGPVAHSQSSMVQMRAAKRVKLQSPSPPTERPIATNSRIKQDQKYRKDMYLAFVNDALQKKLSGITDAFDELVSQFNIKRVSNDNSTPPYQPAQLRLWFSALSHVVSRLERTHATLVQAIVGMPWTTLDGATVKSYTIFLGNLVSARPEYLSLILSKIASGFTYQSGLQALDNVGPEASSSPLTRRVVYDRLHELLMHLLSLIPTLSSTLQPLLVRNFPHKRQNQIAQATYIRNILRISSYCPEAAEKILSTIIDRAIQIDVEIQVEIEELEEEEEKGQQEDVFEIDPFDMVIGEGDDSSSESENEAEDAGFSDLSSGPEDNDEDTPELPTNVRHIQEMVKKLDVILNLLFGYFSRTHASTSNLASSALDLFPLTPLPELPPLSPSLSTAPPTPTLTPSPPTLAETLIKRATPLAPPDLLRSQFHTLLSIFDRTILRTFKSRYTQFLIFWFTSLDPEFADLFQGMLVDRALFATDATLLNPSADGTNENAVISSMAPTVTRAAAASYIGSFVSRANFVDRVATRHVVGVLCEFLRAHLDAVDEAVREWGTAAVTGDGASGGVDRAQNTVFYAVAQAVFLIFCFRWRDLLEDAEGQEDVSANVVGKKWLPGLNVLQRVVTCVLNPLKVCSSNVVMQFARVAHTTDFLYCYSILESNKRADFKSSNSSPPKMSLSVHPAVQFGDSIAAELNTFFPFDPYRLQRSSSYIQEIYREWSSVAIDDEESDEDEDEGDDDDDMNEDTKSGVWRPESDSAQDSDDESEAVQKSSMLSIPKSSSVRAVDQAADGLGASLDAMSISPAMPGIKALENTSTTASVRCTLS
ncbi:RNA polymerase I-specific transcription initiation factor RRN3 [Amanita rubescens]|nr:RNA polymerase I-specific transcription initiation factor RRN3 [Amanita rubescens]